MKLSKDELRYLANPSCVTCGGEGIASPAADSSQPCACAMRKIFRVCYGRFRSSVQQGTHRKRISYEHAGGGVYRGAWGRKELEFAADFELIARRFLDPFHYRIFRWHHILGAEAKLACRRLGITRGVFFHSVYRLEARLGEAYASTRPYPLYPIRDYFLGRASEPVRPCQPAIPRPAWTYPSPFVSTPVRVRRAA